MTEPSADKNKTQYLFAALVMFVLMIGLIAVFMGRDRSYEVVRINDGWSISYGDQHEENVSLDSFKTSHRCKAGDVMVLTRKLGLDANRAMSLTVYSRLSAVESFLDDENVYSYNGDWSESGEFSGSGYHFVLLPDDIKGKTLTVRLTATEEGAISGVPEIYISPSDETYAIFVQTKEIGIMISVFLIIGGLAMLLISMFGMVLDNDFYPLIMIGYFAMLAGIWSIFTMKGAEIFSDRFRVNSIMEYGALYLLPLPIARLTLMSREHLSGIARKILWGAHNLMLILLGVFLVLHHLNIIHISQLTFIFHMILLVGTPILLFVRPGQWKILTESERLFQIGMWVSVAVGIGDVIWYYINVFVFHNVSGYADLALPVGFLLIFVVFVTSYLLEIYARRLSKNEKEYLLRMAYEDELTGLYNRLKGEEVISEAADWNEEFAIINIDLNGLKKVNDKFGHAHGDAYISKFAGILKEVFGREEVVARMGGDEFFVVLRGADRISKLPGMLERMKELEKEDSEGEVFDVDASYGVARSTELTYPNAEALYQMADQRMYHMKKLSGRGRTW